MINDSLIFGLRGIFWPFIQDHVAAIGDHVGCGVRHKGNNGLNTGHKKQRRYNMKSPLCTIREQTMIQSQWDPGKPLRKIRGK